MRSAAVLPVLAALLLVVAIIASGIGPYPIPPQEVVAALARRAVGRLRLYGARSRGDGRAAHLGAFAAPGKPDLGIAMAMLERLGIADLAEREANRISGGRLQLALIARALAQQASIIVMDEPTASLDLGNRVLVLNTVKALAGEGLAVLLSTHEPEQALAIADHVALLEHGRPFATGNAMAMLTAERLSRLYGVRLSVEMTPSGRRVVTTSAEGLFSADSDHPVRSHSRA